MGSRVANAELGELPTSAKQAMMMQPDFKFLLAKPEWNDRNLAASLEGLSEQAFGGAYEASLYRKPWGFDIADIEIAVHEWHGDTAGSAPYPTQGRVFQDRLRNGHCVIYPGEGHLTVMDGHQVEIMKTLVDTAKRGTPIPHRDGDVRGPRLVG